MRRCHPRMADDYYGPNETFRAHVTENPSSWMTTYREAIGNGLKVSVSGGTLLHNYPMIIQADQQEVAVSIEGGVGYVPIRFEGLKRATGYTLYQLIDGVERAFDQSVLPLLTLVQEMEMLWFLELVCHCKIWNLFNFTQQEFTVMVL